MGDRTISSFPTDVDDLDNSNNDNSNNKEEQPPGLTECSFSSSESSESSNNYDNKEEIVVSLVENSKAVVTSCDEGYEIIPTRSTTNNNNYIDKVHQTAPTTRITPPSSNKNMNHNQTIEVETTTSPSSSTPSASTTSTSTSPQPDNNNKAVEHQTTEVSKREAETSIYATLSSAADSIRTRQISIATQPTSNAALSNGGGSNNVVDIDENIDGADISTTDLKSTTDVDALASNNDAVLDNELTISTNSKTQSQTKLPRVQSDTVSEYYQWYEDNVTSNVNGNDDDDDDCSIAAESNGGCTNSTFGCTINADDFDIVDACGIFAWYMNKQVEIAAMRTPWYDDCKSDNP